MIVKVATFRNNMAYYLEHLDEDIFLTRHGKVIGVVSAPDVEAKRKPPGELEICVHELNMLVRHLNALLPRSDNKKPRQKRGFLTAFCVF